MENINLRTVDRNFEDYLEDVLLSGTNYNDKYVAAYESTKIATKAIGLKSNSTIFAALKDHSKSAGGYKWYYADDINQPDKTKIIA